MQQALLSAADSVGRMIETARRELAQGRPIDAVKIEAVVADIHKIVEDHAELVRRDGGPQLSARLQALLAELTELEADLVAQPPRPAAGA